MEPYKSEKEEEANHATTSNEVTVSYLLSLPGHLIFDLLSRLPVRTIFICKCVCNTFKNILSDPLFVQLHLANTSKKDYSLVIQDEDFPRIFLTPLLNLHKHLLDTKNQVHGKYLPWQRLNPPASIPKTNTGPKTWRHFVMPDVLPSLIGSCNGLFCLKYYVPKDEVVHFYICNPILGEFTMLPQSREDCQFAGFGFCPKTNQYKVLRFIHQSRNKYILTLGIDDDWREISDPPPGPFKVEELDSSYKGNLHWIDNKSICSFNLETERHSYISLPTCYIESSNNPCLQIGTLDGLFCVSCLLLDQFEAYVMEDYDKKSSWIKRVSIDTSENFLGECISTVRFLDNGVWLLNWDNDLTYYDTRRELTYYIKAGGQFSATVHIPSLMSLKDIVRIENVEQVNRRMLGIYCTAARKFIV